MKKYTIGFTLTLLTLLLHTSAFAQCVAGFNISSINGLEVSFNNESIDSLLVTGALPDVEWTFGDGTSGSTVYDAVHTYAAAGTYEVCVYVTSPNCTDLYCYDVIVGTVECSSYEIEVSNNVGGAVGIAGSIYNVTDFGPYEPDVVEWYIQELGVTIANTPTFAESFPLGVDPFLNYTICVDYEVDGLICTGFCEPLIPPTSNCADFNIDVVVNGGLEVSGGIYNTAGNTPIVAEWYVQELNFVFANTPTFSINLPPTTFPVQDNYTICVDFEDDGVACTLCEVYTIGTGNCVYALDIDTSGMTASGELLLAPDAIYPDTITWILEGGGGVIGTGNDFTYTFTNPGDYEICAIYEVNSVCSGFICDSISIGNMPNCNFGIGFSYNVFGYDATFEIDCPVIPEISCYDVEWEIGNTTGTGNSFDYTLPPGTSSFLACMTAEILDITTGITCLVDTCQLIEIPCEPLEFSSNINGQTGTFEVIQPPSFPGFVWINPVWYIDGDSIESVNVFDYQFAGTGFYEVCLAADLIDFEGTFYCYQETCATIEIVSNNDCETAFEYTINNDGTATFESFCSDVPEIQCYDMLWIIGNDTIGTASSTLTWPLPPGVDSMEVCLTTWMTDITTGLTCQADTCQMIYTQPGCMDLEFTSDLNGLDGIFELIQTPANILEWINPVWYIDGDSMEAVNIFDYEFPSAGVYEVCLVADLVDLGLNYICTQEVCEIIEIQGGSNLCEAYFEWEEITSGVAYGVLFENGSTGNYTEAAWTFGDGSTEVTTSNLVDYAYNNPGVYTVCLTVFDAATGCQDSYCENVLVSGQLNCDYEVTYTLSGNTVELIISDSMINYPAVAEWYDQATGNTYGNGNDVTITLPGIGTYEICVDYENPGTACFGTICTTVTINDPDCTANDCVFPGDTNGDFVANNFDVLPVGLEYGATGPLRANASTAWYGQVATDWAGTTTDGINQKHVDCDGNGNIDFPDIDAIQLNYNRTHDGVMPTNLVETPEIWLNFNLDTILVDMAVGNTILVEADIMVATDAMPAEDIYGIAFSINYPAALVIEGSAEGGYYNDSWFGDGSTTLQLEQDVYAQGMIDFGYSRTDQQNISGFGQIGTVSFVMTDNIIGSFGRIVDVEEVLLDFYVTDIRVVNNTGELQGFTGSHAQVLLLNETTDAIINPDLNNFISVYPNPVSQSLHIQSEIINTERIILYDAVGKVMLDKNTSGHHEQLDVADLPTGLYILSIYTNEGLLNKKIIIE